LGIVVLGGVAVLVAGGLNSGNQNTESRAI
jgi:hypothetical protein